MPIALRRAICVSEGYNGMSLCYRIALRLYAAFWTELTAEPALLSECLAALTSSQWQ